VLRQHWLNMAGMAGTSAVSAEQVADPLAAVQLPEPGASDRRAALEAAYGEELDQQFRQLRGRASQVGTASADRASIRVPISWTHRQQYCFSLCCNGSQDPLGAVGSVSSSLDLAAELEQLLAETEEVVQSNMANQMTWQASSVSQMQRAAQHPGPVPGLSAATVPQRMPGDAAGGASRGGAFGPVVEHPQWLLLQQQQ